MELNQQRVVSLLAWMLVDKVAVLPRDLVEVQRYSVAPETVFDSSF